MFKRKRITLMIFFLSSFVFQQGHAAFPNDFSDVIFIDPNISSWAQTATITANVSGRNLVINDTKRNVWPDAFNDGTNCCNRSLWIIAKYEGQWYAATFEFMRVGQINKFAEAVNGQQIKRAPFLGPGKRWEPAEGEVYGFMTSGVARFDLSNNNVRERSNVALYRWGVGPTNNVNFTEVPRGADGRPIGEDDDPEQCVEPEVPEVINASHNYSGSATGTLTVTGTVDETATLNESISILVKDDRSLTFNVDDQTFNTSVAQDGSFSGVFNLDVLGQCDVPITVTGTIMGKTSNGTASGSASCLGSDATLAAVFNATSATAPSFIDERPATPRPRSVCGNNVPIPPIINLLLD